MQRAYNLFRGMYFISILFGFIYKKLLKLAKNLHICNYIVFSARPFPFGVGSLRRYVRTNVQTTTFLRKKLILCKHK